MKTYLVTIMGINIQFVISTSKSLDKLEDSMKNIIREQLPLYQINSLIYENGGFIMNGCTRITIDEMIHYVGTL